MATWEKRRVGRTELQVTSLGLGTATMGGSRIPVTREEARKWSRRLGCRRALCRYGAVLWRRCGRTRRRRCAARQAARRVGAVDQGGALLRPQQRRGGATDGRLAPLPFEVKYDYSYDGIMRSMEDSYQRLGLAKIDILFVHDIGVYQHGAEANAAHMKVLREAAIGRWTNCDAPAWSVRSASA